MCATTLPQTDNELIKAYPTVFDGHIRVMQGEEFHISLATNVKPFCVHMPRTIPFAYRDKLKAELDLLESQHIIAGHNMVRTNCCDTQEKLGQNSDVYRLTTLQPLCHP